MIISFLWIILSDQFFLTVKKNISPSSLTEIQTIKGCAYVIIVTLVIYSMIKCANKKLLQSREEYKELFYNTPTPMLILDAQTNKFKDVNKAALDTYEYSIQEFQSMSLSDIRADTVDDVASDSHPAVYQHKKKNNDVIICQETQKQMTFNKTISYLISTHDITELENAKAELIKREAQLNLILNSITDGFFILSENMVVKRANEQFKQLVEVEVEQVEGKMLDELFPGITEHDLYQKYLHVVANKVAIHFEALYKDRWYHIWAYPFDGGLSVFFRDITDEKENNLARHENEQNLLGLINNTEDLVWSIDVDLKFFTFNEPFAKFYKEYFKEEVWVGKTALTQAGGELHVKRWKSLYERALAGEKFSVDMDFTLNDQSYFTTIRFNPIFNVNQRVIAVGCYLQNITERKLYERRIEQQNAQLKQIAFITSHQVRVPLANILGLTEILDKDNPTSPSNFQIIQHLKSSALQLDKSIKNMVQQTVHIHE
jgi:PAS domain-containing protein